MKIIVDAMGGDLAPKEVVCGALRAAMRGIPVILVGKKDAILREMNLSDNSPLPQNVEIMDAPGIVDMNTDPIQVVKKHADSSMVTALNLLAEGKGDAIVSAGSTGALLTAATLIVKRIPGVRRAAMGPIIPTQKGRCILMDCGANAECSPEFLLQFALMGSVYAKLTLGLDLPRVALLNIGAEEAKGGALQKETYKLLFEASQNGAFCFTGNIEARDVLFGNADLIVTDGFSGNILLKSIEGTAAFFSDELKKMFRRNLATMLSALACMGGLRSLKETMDYRKVGGTAFVGLKKPVIKAHGSSDRVAIENAVIQAANDVERDLPGQIEVCLSSLQRG